MPAPAPVHEVQLFGSEIGPYGDAYLNPKRPNSIHSTLHGLATEAGFMPFWKIAAETALVTNFALNWRAPIEWETTAGDPVILIAGDAVGLPSAYAYRINSDGTVSQDKSFTAPKKIAASAAAIAAALHSDGSTTPYYFVAFGTTGDAEYRNKAGTWAAMTGTPKQCDGFFSENGNLWGIVNGYQARKWPAGTNPVSGTAGAAIDVGNSAWLITGAGLLARSFIVFTKPDGIYVYDIDTNRFENIWPGLAQNPHADTGKGTFTWGPDVYVPLGWGGMVRVTPSLDVLPASPLNGARPDLTTPGTGPIRAMAGDASYLYAALKPFQQELNAGVSLYVQTTNNESSFTDRTSAVTDDDTGTSFSAVTGTWDMYVGSTSRFGGFSMDQVGTATTATFVLEYWNGAAWTSVTFLDYAGRMSRGPGVIVPASRIPTDWAQNAVNSVTRYWLRYRQTGGIFTTTTVREIRLLPDPVPPADGDDVAQIGRDDAGLMTQIIRGYPLPDGTMFWEDVAAYDGDCSLGLIFTRLKATGVGRALIGIGPVYYVRYPLGPRISPDQQRYADVTNGFTSLLRLPADDRISERARAPGVRKGIAYIDLYVRNFDSGNDIVQAWVSWDGAAVTYYGLSRVVPSAAAAGRIRLRVDRAHGGRGYQYAVHVGLQDGSVGERVPKVTRVVAGVFDAGPEPESR